MYNGLLILDIDNTLVDSRLVKPITHSLRRTTTAQNAFYFQCITYTRPFLQTFIKECFKQFKYVAIWTAGSTEWAENFVKNVLKMEKRKFLFIWDVRECVQVKNKLGNTTNYFKPLHKVWTHNVAKKLKLDKSNTFLIDDREDNGVANKSNQLTIPEYHYYRNDNVLEQLVVFFRELDFTNVQEAIKKIKLVRHIEI